MAKKSPKLLLQGIVDRPKTLLVIDRFATVSTLEVLFIRVYAMKVGRHRTTKPPMETVAVAITPKLVNANQPIRYANTITVQGDLQEVLVIPHAQDAKAVQHLLKANRAKLLQLQATWFAHDVARFAGADKFHKKLANITANWPEGSLQLADYQRKVRDLAGPYSELADRRLTAMQAHQRKFNAQTQAALMGRAIPLLLIAKPRLHVLTNSDYARPQRARDAVDVTQSRKPAYLQQQAREIMLDYQYAQANHLPLSGKTTPLSDAELAQWQRQLNVEYFN
ncbi:hypothetical protein [Lacticaseibacillus jixiensis]|uniref:hypothetical protein n=1 Tax=Lacticaseibacillus jixiensis TaxID=3231926 RepID=UPI0036F3F819